MITIFHRVININNNRIRIVNKKKKDNAIKLSTHFKDVKYTRQENKVYD